MKRLFRWALNLSAAVSAVLVVGVCVLWVRSLWVGETWAWKRQTGAWHGHPILLERDLSTDRAGLWLTRSRGVYSDPVGRFEYRRYASQTADSDGIVGGGGLAGFRWERVGWGYVNPTLARVRVPYYFIALAGAALPAAWLRGRRAGASRRRAAAGLCVACGYDLRATPVEGGTLLGRCPECGTIPGGSETRRQLVRN